MHLHSSPGAATRVPACARAHTHADTHTHTLCAEEETRKYWGYPTNMAANLNFQVADHLARIFFFFNYLFFVAARGFL